MPEFMTHLVWQDVAAVIGLLFGIISTIGYLEQRRSAKRSAVLVEFARRNVDRNIKQEELDQLDKRHSTMTQQIVDSIPTLARKAVLKEQIQRHANAVAHHLTEWRTISAELDELPSDARLDPAIQQEISERILPAYERERELDRMRNRIIALSVSMAVASALLPSEIKSPLATLLAILLTFSLFRFVKLQETPADFERIVRWCMVAAVVATLVTGGVVGGAFIYYQARGTTGWRFGGWLIILTLVLLIGSPIWWRLVKRYAAILARAK